MSPTPDTANETELVAYIRERDQKRRNNIVIAIIIAIPVAIAGFGFRNYLEEKRADDRFNDKQVCQFAGFDDC